MPRYEYQCKECEHKFTKMQSIKDDSIPECPKCSGEAKKLISSGGGFIMEGSNSTSGNSGSTPSCPTGTCGLT